MTKVKKLLYNIILISFVDMRKRDDGRKATNRYRKATVMDAYLHF